MPSFSQPHEKINAITDSYRLVLFETGCIWSHAFTWWKKKILPGELQVPTIHRGSRQLHLYQSNHPVLHAARYRGRLLNEPHKLSPHSSTLYFICLFIHYYFLRLQLGWFLHQRRKVFWRSEWWQCLGQQKCWHWRVIVPPTGRQI